MDPYKILGISSSASQLEVMQAFQKQSIQATDALRQAYDQIMTERKSTWLKSLEIYIVPVDYDFDANPKVVALNASKEIATRTAGPLAHIKRLKIEFLLYLKKTGLERQARDAALSNARFMAMAHEYGPPDSYRPQND